MRDPGPGLSLAARSPLLWVALLLFCIVGGASRADSLPPVMPGGPPASELAEWWISPTGEPLGPYSEAELLQFAEAGDIGPATYVWRDGMAAWARLGEVEALGKVAGAARRGEDERRKQAFADYLVGNWYVEGPQKDDQGAYYSVLRVTFRPDGSFAGSEYMTSAGYEPQMIVLKGRWSITVTGESSFDVAMVEEANPFTWKLVILGPDTLENTVDGSRMERR